MFYLFSLRVRAVWMEGSQASSVVSCYAWTRSSRDLRCGEDAAQKVSAASAALYTHHALSVREDAE